MMEPTYEILTISKTLATLTQQTTIFNKKEKKFTWYHEKLDVENKIASYDALSKYELYEIKTQLKQKIVRRWGCLWCGNELCFNTSMRDGKSKNYCDFDCNRRYNVFTSRLEGLLGPKNTHETESIFIEYCKIKLLSRTPANMLKDQLKHICKKGIPLPMIFNKSDRTR